MLPTTYSPCTHTQTRVLAHTHTCTDEHAHTHAHICIYTNIPLFLIYTYFSFVQCSKIFFYNNRNRNFSQFRHAFQTSSSFISVVEHSILKQTLVTARYLWQTPCLYSVSFGHLFSFDYRLSMEKRGGFVSVGFFFFFFIILS